VKNFKRSYDCLSFHYQKLDISRMSIAYFIFSGLDLLGNLDLVSAASAINWIYAQEITPNPDDPTDAPCLGFRGGPWTGCQPHGTRAHEFDNAHITMTYTALAALVILGDDLSRVNRKAIVDSLKTLQREDGSFCPAYGEPEFDMRFVFCACAISHMLKDWSGVNTEAVVRYIQNSQSYDFGIAQGPAQEAHGGSTFCALASLKLLNRLDALPNREGLIEWLVSRQVADVPAGCGFQGRINKLPDTCYSFWIGASLHILESLHLIDQSECQKFSRSCQFVLGGFKKHPDPTSPPDLMHSYLGLAGFALQERPGVAPLCPELNISIRAFTSL